MKHKGEKPRRDKILEQAAYWYAETRDKNFSQDDRQELQNWLAENPEHQTAFDEIRQISVVVNELFPEGSPEWEDALSRWVLTEKIPSSVTEGKYRKSTGRLIPFPRWQGIWKPAVAMAAMIVMVVLLRPVFMEMWSQHSEIAVESFHTAIGESREVVLEDGSRMKLNTNSTVTTKFSRNQRLVQLSEGEAFFNVVGDIKRPFLVCALSGEVRVLGTAFNVRNRREKVSVDVARGRVQVRKLGRRESGPGGAVVLKANQGVSYKEWGNLGEVRASCTEEVLAWQQDKLVFHSEPLSDVLKQVEDYYPVRLKLADSSLAGQCLTGTFENRSLEEILDSIQTAFDLKAVRQDGVIVLKRL
ncbi:MAG: FecR family protein [Proteobacteria bacterium]|nr:FecR family protein [Pseudomonadota bacterium]